MAAAGRGPAACSALTLWDKLAVDRCRLSDGCSSPLSWGPAGAPARPRDFICTEEPSGSRLDASPRPPPPTTAPHPSPGHPYTPVPQDSICGLPTLCRCGSTMLSATCWPAPQGSPLDADPRTCNNNDFVHNRCRSQCVSTYCGNLSPSSPLVTQGLSPCVTLGETEARRRKRS